ncbi:hypothetical protein TRICHSKD4_4072 [Roseibium sp. TrichSKD4]|nr:hypothetical protein TRICHSKD4_4072 [Roseibium sp. TrichSKD4]
MAAPRTTKNGAVMSLDYISKTCFALEFCLASVLTLLDSRR